MVKKAKTWHGALGLCVGIVGIVAMQMNAMAHGHDGVLLTTCVATIAAMVAGYCGFAWSRKGE